MGRPGRKSRANAGARLRDILQQEAKDLKVSQLGFVSLCVRKAVVSACQALLSVLGSCQHTMVEFLQAQQQQGMHRMSCLQSACMRQRMDCAGCGNRAALAAAATRRLLLVSACEVCVLTSDF